MPTESKTARASAVRVAKEVRVETTEEAIQAIRNNLDAGLHIGDMSRVAKLLAAYDEAVGLASGLKTSVRELENGMNLPPIEEITSSGVSQ